jgi:PEP-CTERM motif
MKTIRRILTVGSVALIACGISMAGTITVNCTTASGTTELGNGTNSSTNSTITCGDFNTSLGFTLNSISITLNGAIISPSTVTISNNDNTSHTGFASADSSFSLDSTTPLTPFVFTTVPGPNVSTGDTNYLFDVFAFTGTQTLGANPNAPASCNGNVNCSKVVGVSGSGSDTGVNNNSATFGAYSSPLGAGTFNIVADTETALSGCTVTGGQGGCQQATVDSFTASVTYTYSTPSSTPEPTTLFLMGSALVGVGLLRKRIKS